jgi:hypothetical protein
MGSNFIGWLWPLAVLASLSATMDGQEVIPPARAVLDLSEGEQIAFINRTMDLGFPEDRADQMTMLIINRSALTSPLIEAKLEEALKSTPAPKGFVETASEMITYAGDERALRAVSKLVALDENRFGRLVGRILDNAGNWRNPFNVVYGGLEIGNEAISRHIVVWVESALASNRMQRAWAEAMLDRYGKVPGGAEWATDPIVFQLNGRALPELRQSVVRFAAEAQSKRERR